MILAQIATSYMALYRQSVVTFAHLAPFQRYYSFCALNTNFFIPHSCSTWTFWDVPLGLDW